MYYILPFTPVGIAIVIFSLMVIMGISEAADFLSKGFWVLTVIVTIYSFAKSIWYAIRKEIDVFAVIMICYNNVFSLVLSKLFLTVFSKAGTSTDIINLTLFIVLGGGAYLASMVLLGISSQYELDESDDDFVHVKSIFWSFVGEVFGFYVLSAIL